MVREGKKHGGGYSKKKKHDGCVSLPEDIVFDVLARLPAKALCRFRCVSKAWRALISDPTFVAAQRSRVGPHLVGVYFGISTSPSKVQVFDMDGNVVRELEVRQLGKDNGAVLQQATTTGLGLICALGPRGRVTGRWCTHTVIIDLAAGGAFTVGTDIHFAGLSTIGRAALSGAFKILNLEATTTSPYWTFNVATILDSVAEGLTWRQSAPPFAISWDPEKSVTIKGIIYFMARLGEQGAASNSGRSRIAAFDIEREEWKVTYGPAFGIQEKISDINLTDYKGSLCVFQFFGHLPLGNEAYDDECYAIIWLLVDPNKSVWVKEYTIQMPKTWTRAKQLGALDDGRILFRVSEFLNKVLTNEDKITYHSRSFLVFYNPSTRMFTEFGDTPVELHDKFVLYTGSLLSS